MGFLAVLSTAESWRCKASVAIHACEEAILNCHIASLTVEFGGADYRHVEQACQSLQIKQLDPVDAGFVP